MTETPSRHDKLSFSNFDQCEFGLTPGHVTQAINEEIDRSVFALSPAESSVTVLEQIAKQTRSIASRNLQALRRQSPEKTLEYLRRIKDRVFELSQDQGETEVGVIIIQEFPDINSFYSLLRLTRWGYRLGQVCNSLETHQKALEIQQAKNKGQR